MVEGLTSSSDGHLVDGRERHRLRMLDDVLGNALLRLREAIVVAAKLVDDVAGTDRLGRALDLGSAHQRLASPLGPELARKICNKIRCSQRRQAQAASFRRTGAGHRRD